MADPQHNDEGITAEVMAVIEEAAAVYLGRKVRIVSVKVHSHSEDGHNTWGEEGRAGLQTSHNLVQRGH
jgi:hypothetical protein